MAIIRGYVKSLLGPAMSHKVARVLHGRKMDEVGLVFEAFSQVGIVGTMVDVGAHQGGSLHPFAVAGWKVFAFEPDPANRRELVTLVARYPNVLVDPRGISNECRSNVPFFTSNVSTGISGLGRFHDSHQQTQTIDIITIEELTREMEIVSVDFVKVDIEGYDLLALQGIPWDRFVPTCIVCEFEDRKTIPNGYSVDDMIVFLSSKGYDVTISEWHPIKEYGGNHSWKAFRKSSAQMNPDAWGNLVAVQRNSPVAGYLSWESLSQHRPK